MASIRTRILLLLALALLAPIGILFLVSSSMVRKALSESSYERLDETSAHIATQVNAIVIDASTDVEKLLVSPKLTEPGYNEQDRVDEIQRLTQHFELLDHVTLYNPDGFPIGSTDPREIGNQESTTWFQAALEGRKALSSPQRKLGSRNLYISVYIPVIQSSGIVEILKASVSLEKVWNLVDRARIGNSGYALVIDQFGNVLAHPNRGFILERYSPSLNWDDQKRTRGITKEMHTEDELAFSAIRFRLPAGGPETMWAVIVAQPVSEFFAPQRRLDGWLFWAGIGSLSLATVISFAAAGAVARPLSITSQAAKEVATGRRDTRISETGSKEIRVLAAAFNSMVDRVRTHEEGLEALVENRTKRLSESRNSLRSTTAQLRSTNDASRDAILVIGLDGRILEVNAQLTKLFGMSNRSLRQTRPENLFSRLAAGFSSPDEFETYARLNIAATAPEAESEWELVEPEAKQISIFSAPVLDTKERPMARLWIFSDLTERRELQRGLEQAQKMEAVGRLAGGVAHDFNNLLTGISGNLHFAVDRLTDLNTTDPKLHRFLDLAQTTCGRATQLVAQLLGFSRQTDLRLDHADAGEIVSEVADLMMAGIDRRIEIQTEVSEPLEPVEVDSTRLGQVIMNLAVNARDAMTKGGTLGLSARNLCLDEQRADRLGLPSGSYVEIIVQDTGEGIADAVRDKIFDPFFTTKPLGEGTGLGLATSYGIIRQHGGLLSFETEVDIGTTFSILLPTSGKLATPQPVESPAKAEEAIYTTEKKILLVDDEAIVRSIAEGLLTRDGFGVEIAGDGLHALKVVASAPETFGLVILDLSMPKLSGAETFAELRTLYPRLPVLICSGYPVDLDKFATECGGLRPEGSIQKPYKFQELTATATELLTSDFKAA